METYKWVVEREKELLSKLGEMHDELDTLKVVKEYLHKTFFVKDAQRLFDNYLLNIEAYCNWQKIDINGFKTDPDESFMRDIEEKIGISENAKKAFREEVLIRISSYNRKGKTFDYTSHERLKEAIEKSL